MTEMLLLQIHLFCTLSMVGVIWFVQVVHYPLFRLVGPDSFAMYEKVHQSRTTWVVAPLMLIEAGTALLLVPLAGQSTAAFSYLVWIGLALVAVNWGSTFLIQVPAHRHLSEAFDSATHNRLVWTNWIRTFAWTVRGVLACGLVLIYQ